MIYVFYTKKILIIIELKIAKQHQLGVTKFYEIELREKGKKLHLKNKNIEFMIQLEQIIEFIHI